MAIELAPSRRSFTIGEFLHMIDAGVFREDEPVELLDGEVVEVSPIGEPHTRCVLIAGDILVEPARSAAIVSQQNPVRLGAHSRPQPDIAVLKSLRSRYARCTPSAEDLLLVVEVADTSLRYDRDKKMPTYADAGVPEAWLVDLVNELVHVYREPSSDGYHVIQTARRGETIAPAAFPDWRISVDDLLPAAQ